MRTSFDLKLETMFLYKDLFDIERNGADQQNILRNTMKSNRQQGPIQCNVGIEFQNMSVIGLSLAVFKTAAYHFDRILLNCSDLSVLPPRCNKYRIDNKIIRPIKSTDFKCPHLRHFAISKDGGN